jgi:hypothetical protein
MPSAVVLSAAAAHGRWDPAAYSMAALGVGFGDARD